MKTLIFLTAILCLFNRFSFCQQDSVLFIGDFNNRVLVEGGRPNAWQNYDPNRTIPYDHRRNLDSLKVRQGRYSMKVELRPGDTSQNGNDRAEVEGMLDRWGNDLNINEKSGTQYLAFSVMLDSNWQAEAPGYYGTILQLHKHLTADYKRVTTGPDIAIQLQDSFFLRLSTGYIFYPVETVYPLSNNQLNRGSWIDFVLKIKFSTDTSGEIMMWRRDKNQSAFSLILHANNIKTLLYDSSEAGIKALDHLWHTGYYRYPQKTDGTGITNILWLDGFTLATSPAAAQLNAFNSVVELPGDDRMNTVIARAATGIDTSRFTANWTASQDATSYRLDVSTSSSFNKTSAHSFVERFNNGISSLQGWQITGSIIENYDDFGKAAPSLQFTNSKKQLTTKIIIGTATELRFWLKGLNTDSASSLLLEGFDGLNWIPIHNITDLPATGVLKKYNAYSNPPLADNFYRFRFTYYKSSGDLLVDDVSIKYNTITPFFITGYNNRQVDGTSKVVTGLAPKTKYHYRVRAVNNNDSSSNSNVITVTTGTSSSINKNISTGLNVNSTEPLKVNISNPTLSEFNLFTQTNNVENVEIVVTNIYGKKVWQAKGLTNATFSFGKDLPQGIYFLKIAHAGSTQTIKLLKVKN